MVTRCTEMLKASATPAPPWILSTRTTASMMYFYALNTYAQSPRFAPCSPDTLFETVKRPEIRPHMHMRHACYILCTIVETCIQVTPLA
jgi:hypothetical protein